MCMRENFNENEEEFMQKCVTKKILQLRKVIILKNFSIDFGPT